jgi:predicted nucleic acid-binding protein
VSPFVDTSALYAALSARDENHPVARELWTALLARDEQLVTSNYILVETFALVGRRLGLQAVRDLQQEFIPVLDVAWVEPALHERAVAALLTAGSRDLSLVDCTSFEIMRQRGLRLAFAFDAHFSSRGFRCLPEVGRRG